MGLRKQAVSQVAESRHIHPAGRKMTQMVGAFAEFERDMRKEQTEGGQTVPQPLRSFDPLTPCMFIGRINQKRVGVHREPHGALDGLQRPEHPTPFFRTSVGCGIGNVNETEVRYGGDDRASPHGRKT